MDSSVSRTTGFRMADFGERREEFVLVTVEPESLLKNCKHYKIMVRFARLPCGDPTDASSRAPRATPQRSAPPLSPCARPRPPAQGLDTPNPIMRIDGQELIGSYEEETTAMLFGDRARARTPSLASSRLLCATRQAS